MLAFAIDQHHETVAFDRKAFPTRVTVIVHTAVLEGAKGAGILLSLAAADAI